jgi:hypothetical protein
VRIVGERKRFSARAQGIGVAVVSWYPPGTQDAVQGGKEIMVEDGILMPLV